MIKIFGVLQMTKTEKKNIALLIEHAERDISFLGGGTYSTDKLTPDGDAYVPDMKSIEKAREAILVLKWMLDKMVKTY